MQAYTPGQGYQAQEPSMSGSVRARAEESWVEIETSQHNSEASSSGTDEIVTTGLRVQELARRRRRPRMNLDASPVALTPGSADLSSQEEYDESESDSDRVLTSSNEGIDAEPFPQPKEEAATFDSDDENRTAVNYPIRRTTDQTVFTPQPNAFSHPPHSYIARHASEPGPASYFPPFQPQRDRSATLRHYSSSSQDARPRLSPNRAVTRSAAHHDAALRASLSTLLSCAAAARALPKISTEASASASPQVRRNRIDTTTLRLVPESALPTTAATEPDFQPTLRPRSSSTASSRDQAKRPASRGRRSPTHQPRPKKQRRSSSASTAAYDDASVSPTLLTWVVSAGVVVALSAITFSAGYAIGHEAGRVEGLAAQGSCAAEVGRGGIGLRRLRFTAQA